MFSKSYPSADLAGFGHARDGDHVGSEAVVDADLLGHVVHGLESVGHLAVELLLDLVQQPVVVIGVLHLL